MAAFSFHETKNIIAGEGGMLTINDEQFNLSTEFKIIKIKDFMKFYENFTNKDW